MSNKVPIETLPVELRIHVYEFGDVSRITMDQYCERFNGSGAISPVHGFPWARTILMSGILNDKEALKRAAIQGGKPRKIMCSYIAYSGNLPMLKWARSEESVRQLYDAAVMDRSTKEISFDAFPWDKWTCGNAAKFGHFNLVKWMHKQGCPLNTLTFSYVAEFGNLEMLEWLYEKKCPWNSDTCTFAARAGQLDALKWLHERKCQLKEFGISTAAVVSGNLEMVEWLDQQDIDFMRNILDVIAEEGNLEMMRWFLDHPPSDKSVYGSAYETAALHGQLEILQCLQEKRCPWGNDCEACAFAAGNGHFEILQWLHEQGFPLNISKTAALAAKGNHLEILKWLHEHGPTL